MQTAEPTLGDTSVVSQSVTNNRRAPHVGGGAQEKSVGGTSTNFRPSLLASIVPASHLQIASDTGVDRTGESGGFARRYDSRVFPVARS